MFERHHGHKHSTIPHQQQIPQTALTARKVMILTMTSAIELLAQIDPAAAEVVAVAAATKTIDIEGHRLEEIRMTTLIDISSLDLEIISEMVIIIQGEVKEAVVIVINIVVVIVVYIVVVQETPIHIQTSKEMMIVLEVEDDECILKYLNALFVVIIYTIM